MSSVRARPLTVAPPPAIFLQLVQWQLVTRMNGTSTSNRTPPHQHVPVSALTGRSLVSRLVPAFEAGSEIAQIHARVRAVDEAVVVRQRQVHQRPDRDDVVPELVLYDPWPLHERIRAEDRRLGLVDDRRPVEGPEAAGVGDGEGAALDVVREELLRPRALGDVGDRAGGALEVQVLRVPDHRDDQAFPLLERDRDAEVDIRPRNDALAADLAV